LLTVAGRQFVEHQLELLKLHGARRIVLAVGYLGEKIEAAIGDGSRFGLEVSYAHDGPQPAGTAGALRRALPLLGDEFLVLYGDTYLRIDYADVARALRESGLPALMTVLRNRGRWAPSNAVYQEGRVVAYDKAKPPSGAEWIDYGILAFERSALEAEGPDDLADLMHDLAAGGQLAGYPASKRFYEIGSPEALAETEAFLSGRPADRVGSDAESSVDDL
jgi:N-acetyl-alpha-D-muramate 1-phosphate uridylyltransferase